MFGSLIGSGLKSVFGQSDDVWDPFRYPSSEPVIIPYPKRRPGLVEPRPEPVQDLAVNPIQDYEQLYYPLQQEHTMPHLLPLPHPEEEEKDTYLRPVPEDDDPQPLGCKQAFPSKWVDDNEIASYEQMGLNIAQRHIVPAGGGEVAYADQVPL